MSEDAICDKVNEASLVYADSLNQDLMTYVKRLVKSFGLAKDSYMVAPYTYFYYGGFDVDIKNEMIPHNYDGDEPLQLYQHADDLDRTRITMNYMNVLNNYARGWNKKNIVLGLVGITMAQEDNTDDNSAHYISYVYFKGRAGKKARLCMFDSGGWRRDEIYYYLMKDTFDVAKSDLELNTGVFEKDGGESKSEFTYVGQNIFCHTWSLWFWNQLLGNGLSMKEISALAGKRTMKNRDNLVRIKTYIYTVLIPTVKLKFDSERDEKLFMRNFRYIFSNKEAIRKLVIPAPA